MTCRRRINRVTAVIDSILTRDIITGRIWRLLQLIEEDAMATQAAPNKTVKSIRPSRAGIFSGQRGMKRKETFLAYLLLLPAIFIIGLFGLFPLVFSAYQSTRAGLNNIVGRPDGLGQYLRAIDNLAYVLAFWLALFFLFIAIRKIFEIRRESKERNEKPWLWVLPATFVSVGIAGLLRFIFIFMPNLLEVGEKMKGLTAEERNEQFLTFIREAWQVDSVAAAFWTAVVLIIIGVVIYNVLQRNIVATPRDSFYFSGLMTAVLLITLAIGLTWITYSEIQLAYAEALEEGQPLTLWAQMVTISAGFLMLLFSWLLWQNASQRGSNLRMFIRFTAAIFFMVGGWVLIAELPAVIAEGNSDWWDGLKNTVFYVLGALPIELFLGLFLAVLMFQEIKGKGLFRMVYFLPYITPAVGAAGVFKVIFTGNPSGLINTALAQLGFESLGWLNEPTGINSLIGEVFNLNIPDWAAGPSLALVVAVIFGIWKFTGYNVVFFLAGLGNISRELYEAASIDGAGRWSQFRHITLPLLSPITYFLTIFGVIGTFKTFNTIYVLRTGAALGTMDTASLVIFDAFNRDTRYGYAAALGIILLIVILSATSLFDRLSKGRVFYG